MKTLITWPHGSADGEREATRLHQKYASGSTAVASSDLEHIRGERFELLIVVGRHDEIEAKDTLDTLIYNANVLEIPYVALANCHPASDYHQIGEFDELWAVAQHFADEMGADVLATTRALTCDEVGEGKVFAGSEEGVRPINPDGVQVWKEFRRHEHPHEEGADPHASHA